MSIWGTGLICRLSPLWRYQAWNPPEGVREISGVCTYVDNASAISLSSLLSMSRIVTRLRGPQSKLKAPALVNLRASAAEPRRPRFCGAVIAGFLALIG